MSSVECRPDTYLFINLTLAGTKIFTAEAPEGAEKVRSSFGGELS
jgi:hypothetical protein